MTGGQKKIKNKCLFGADLSLIYTARASLLQRFMLKMTPAAEEENENMTVICSDGHGEAPAFVVVIQCVRLPAHVNLTTLPDMSSYITSVGLS